MLEAAVNSIAAAACDYGSPSQHASSPFEPSPVVELPGARRMLRARQPQPSEMMLAVEDGLGFEAVAGGRNLRGSLAAGGGGLGGALRPLGAQAGGSPAHVPAHVYVVVHAIDSAGLRGEESQAPSGCGETSQVSSSRAGRGMACSQAFRVWCPASCRLRS